MEGITALKSRWGWLVVLGLLIFAWANSEDFSFPDLLICVGALGFPVAGFALFRPVSSLWMTTKATAGIGLGVAFALMMVGAGLQPEPTAEEIAARNAEREERQRQRDAEQEARRAQIEAERQRAIEERRSDVTFAQIDALFGVEGTLTDLQKEAQWKRYEGKCVTWTGRLADLGEGVWGGLELGFKHKRHTLTADVQVKAPDSLKSQLMTWQKGNRYTYEATLREYGGAILPITADWGCE